MVVGNAFLAGGPDATLASVSVHHATKDDKLTVATMAASVDVLDVSKDALKRTPYAKAMTFFEAQVLLTKSDPYPTAIKLLSVADIIVISVILSEAYQVII
jgi:hypothetical protein